MIFYPCTIENLANPLYEEADPTYGIWIYDPRDGTQQPIVIAEDGFTFTEVVSADPRPTPPVILDSINVFADDPDLVADGRCRPVSGKRNCTGHRVTVRRLQSTH